MPDAVKIKVIIIIGPIIIVDNNMRKKTKNAVERQWSI